jgi:hypothetical protein
MKSQMITIEKKTLQKGHSYVLKTSLLTEALTEAGIECHLHLIYWMPKPEGSILQAFYWLPNENVPFRRVYLRAGSLPSEQRKSALEKLCSEGLPAFVAWLKRLVGLPDSSPIFNSEPFFDAEYHGSNLLVSAKPLPN